MSTNLKVYLVTVLHHHILGCYTDPSKADEEKRLFLAKLAEIKSRYTKEQQEQYLLETRDIGFEEFSTEHKAFWHWYFDDDVPHWEEGANIQEIIINHTNKLI